MSRPDIAFAVNKVCQFMHAPTENHWVDVKRILRYLKGTLNLGLLFRHNTGSRLQAFSDSHLATNLRAFSDSDWADCPIDRRSTGGYAIYLVQILFHGPLANNDLSLDLQPSLNIRLLMTL